MLQTMSEHQEDLLESNYGIESEHNFIFPLESESNYPQ